MAISERAQRNHDELFPDHTSTLKVTDPELLEIFDNWAFDEVLEDGTLDTRTRLMVQLAAILACGAVNDRRVLVSTITQLLPFIGYPRTLDAMRVINEAIR
jgi:4-carboxymuconolactone decarboxylase